MLDLVKLAGILALILLLLRLRWNLGLVLTLAAVATGVIYDRAPRDLLLDMLAGLTDPLTLQLIAIVLLITFLSQILRSSLQLEGLIRSSSDLVTDRRALLALLPMFIGLLPMAGGAMFSAPMVEEASRGLGLSAERRTFINYWFRHTWETVFPLFPSLILAAGLLRVSPQELARAQWPLFVASVAGGVLFGLVGIGRTNSRSEGPRDRKATWLLLGKSIWPIALVVALALVLGVNLIVSLLLTIAALIVAYRLGPRSLWGLARRTPLDIVPMIAGTMIFRSVLEGCGAVQAVSESLVALGIPAPLLIFALPLVAGLLTGLAAPAFAIAFPIVLPLCGADPVGNGLGTLAYTGGYLGLMLTPVHLCLTLTHTYFAAEWGRLYRFLLPAGALVVAAAVLIVWVK